MANALRAVLGATAIAITAASCSHEAVDPLSALASASSRLPHRMVTGRLAGFSFAPAPRQPHSRASAQATEAELKLRLAASEMLRSPSLHSAGVAWLVNGDLAQAVRFLREAAEKESAKARLWNDLSAVVCEHGLHTNDPRLIAEALAAADRALDLDPRSAEAAFNRAVALESLSLRSPALSAYRHYLTLDASPQWMEEARSRMARLEIPGTSWTPAAEELRRAARRGDQPAVDTIVRHFPQQARTWSEGLFLAEWAETMESPSAADGEAALTIARFVGSSLKRASGESLLAEAVAAIDAARRAGDTARLQELARAHKAYAGGRIALSRRRSSEAIPLLAEADRRFQAAGSPMHFAAACFKGSATFDRDRDAAVRIWERTARALPRSYKALDAQLLWQQATATGSAGRLYEAALRYIEASTRFEAIGEQDNAARTASFAAHALSRLGQRHEAWRMQRRAFAAAEAEDDALLEVLLSEAALGEVAAENWPAVRSLFSIVREASGGKSSRRLADVLRWIACAEWQMKLEGANRSLGVARQAAQSLPEPALRDAAMHDLAVVEAVMIGEQVPTAAARLLSEAIQFAEGRNDHVVVPTLYYHRARTLRHLGDLPAARRDLETATQRIDESRATIRADEIRDSYLGTADDIYRELFDLADVANDFTEAFAVAERARGRLILDRLTGTTDAALPLSLQEVAPQARTLIVQFTVLGDRTAIYTFGRKGFARRVSAAGRSTIRHMIEDFRSAIERNDRAAVRVGGIRLYDALIAPIHADLAGCELLVIVPDGIVDRVPLAALFDRTRGRYLVEDVALTFVPSVSAYARALEMPRRARGAALVVGDPAVDSRAFPPLARLPEARQEARMVAAAYPGATVLMDGSATPRRFLEHLRDAGVIHVSAHAVLNAADPGASALVFAPDGRGSSGLVYLREIVAQKTRADVVALIGCRTAAAENSGTKVSTLALAFLAAGARNVVATLFDVDDQVGRQLSGAFHAGLGRGESSAAALRAAQLHMLHSSDPQPQQVRSWGCFQVYGPGD